MIQVPPAAPRAPPGSGTMLVPQKSELTLLCERFQQQFGHLQPDGSPTLLMLNDVAEVGNGLTGCGRWVVGKLVVGDGRGYWVGSFFDEY